MADQAPPEDSVSTSSTGSDAVTTFPDRLRVHALAKLLGVTSKQVIAALSDIGEPTKNVQSSLTRESALAVQAVLNAGVTPVTDTPAKTAVSEPAASPAAVSQPNLFTNSPQAEIAAPSTEPVAAPSVPLFLQPEPVEETAAPRRRRSKRAAAAPTETVESAEIAPVAEDVVPVDSPRADSEDGSAVAETQDASSQDTSSEDTSADDSGDDSEDSSQPRRRRRGRRGRGRGRGEQGSDGSDGDSDTDDAESSSAPDATGAADDSTDTDAAAVEADSDVDAATVDVAADAPEDSSDEDSNEDSPTRSERRPRRSRGRSRSRNSDRSESTDDDDSSSDANGADEAPAAESDSADQDDFDDDDNGDGSSRRRRRRRRRKSGAEIAADGTTSVDDPPNTVVHEREPRAKARPKDEVQGISGSTRLEAKRQRRRDGRDAGRRRPPILTESEFLARRESVDRVMVVREKAVADQPLITQVAVLEDGVLVEHFVTSSAAASMVGNVYLGRVQNVLPSMEAAFIDIGRGRNGVLYAGEVNWDAAGLGGSARKIEQALKPGDQVLVQVSKDPVGHKGARLTTQLSLAGRFLVYVPGGSSTGISRKLPDTERKRLKDLLRDIVPPEAGVIIRTAAEGVSEEELARDVTRLQAQWASIEERAANAETGQGKQPQTLYEEPDMLVKVIRDLFNEDFSKVVIEGERAWETTSHYIETVAPDLLPRVERFTADSSRHDVFGAHRIDEQLVKALDRKVWLPSGGTLVIDRTEAMTVVDVNTGKFTGAGGNLEETVTRNNLEAAEEVVRQMRLRDIGGMIVVDFIDMVLESNRDLILRRLTEALGRDRTRHQVSEVTSLGLVQMTRKKLGTGLVEAFSTTCEHCQGRGIMVHPFPVEVKADDGGGRSAPARNESNSPRKNRRGRDKSDVVVEDKTPASTPDDHPGPDPSIKRAHPAALAMAAHLGGETAVAENAVAENAVAESAVAETTAPEAPASESAAPEAVSSDTHAAESEVSAVEARDTVEHVGDAAPEDAVSPAEDVVKPVVVRGRRSRRVVRKPAAPAGESADAGTIIVVPTPVVESSDAPAPETAPDAGASDAAAPATSVPDAAVAAPVARPRRRRAAARPAGPPVDAEV